MFAIELQRLILMLALSRLGRLYKLLRLDLLRLLYCERNFSSRPILSLQRLLTEEARTEVLRFCSKTVAVYSHRRFDSQEDVHDGYHL